MDESVKQEIADEKEKVLAQYRANAVIDTSTDTPENFISPVYAVKAIPFELVSPNDYNPNTVASQEFALLYQSIKDYGYTMPIVVGDDTEESELPPDQRGLKPSDPNYRVDCRRFSIIDGYHRYSIMHVYKDIYDREGGKLPCSIVNKNRGDRITATVVHNRARGSHNTDIMAQLVKELVTLGRTDNWIKQHLGMDKDELLRLKQNTGILDLFTDRDYSNAWTTTDIDIRYNDIVARHTKSEKDTVTTQDITKKLETKFGDSGVQQVSQPVEQKTETPVIPEKPKQETKVEVEAPKEVIATDNSDFFA